MVFEIVKDKCAFLVAGITAVVYGGYCFYNTMNSVKKDNVSVLKLLFLVLVLRMRLHVGTVKAC